MAAAPAIEPDAWDDGDHLPEFARLAVCSETEAPVAPDQNHSTSTEAQAASSNAGSRPASRAAPAHGGATEPFVDSSIRDALASSSNRLTVLKFEVEIEDFLKQPVRQQLVFAPNLTPYQRMLAHKTSQYYGLETSTAETGEYAGRIVAVRTASSARPRPMRLSDLKLPDGSNADSPTPSDAPKLLVRRPSSSGLLAGRPPSDDATSATNSEAGGARSVQEREQEYHRARARIFGGDVTASSGPSPEQQPPRQSGDGSNSTRRPSSGGGAAYNGGNGHLGKKAVLRNRQAELQDPDFRRAHGRYAPRYDPGFGERPADQGGAYALPTCGSQFPELPGGGYPGVPAGYAFQAPPPGGVHSRRNSGGMPGMPDMAAAAAAYHAAAAAQQQQQQAHAQQQAQQHAQQQYQQQRGGGAPWGVAAGGGGPPGARPPPPAASFPHQPHQQQHYFQHPPPQQQPRGGPRPPNGHHFPGGYPASTPLMMQVPGAEGHLPQQQHFMAPGMQAVPIAGLPPGYQYIQPAAMPGQQVIAGSMAQFQAVPGMPAMQYAVSGYGYMPRPMAEGMPAAMAAAGYPGVQYPPDAFPMQLAMPQHMQQHQMAMAAMGHLAAPPSPQRQHPRGSGRGSRRSSASSIGRHQRSGSMPQSPQVTPPQPPPLQPQPAAPPEPTSPLAQPPAAAIKVPGADQRRAPPQQLQFGDVPPIGDGLSHISLPSSAGTSPLETFAPQKD